MAEALERSHLDDDVAGINASIELIQRTRGGKWPTGPVTEEEDYADLVWHEVEFRDAFSLSYAVYEADGPLHRLRLPVPDGAPNGADG